MVNLDTNLLISTLHNNFVDVLVQLVMLFCIYNHQFKKDNVY